jgi:hypothetical protein
MTIDPHFAIFAISEKQKLAQINPESRAQLEMECAELVKRLCEVLE